MATIKVELQPFSVPNFVSVKSVPKLRSEGWSESPKYEIKDIDDDTLEEMCREFRAAIFAKKYK